jgi:hypothetical protein
VCIQYSCGILKVSPPREKKVIFFSILSDWHPRSQGIFKGAVSNKSQATDLNPEHQTLNSAFLKALYHTKAKLQIDELKAVLRQLPEVHRNVLNYMLGFMVKVSEHHEDNGATQETLAEAFASKLFRYYEREAEEDDDAEFDDEDGSPEDKEKLVLLMLQHHHDLEGTGVRNRAARASVLPEGTLTVNSSPASGRSSVQNVSSTMSTMGASTMRSINASHNLSSANASPDKPTKSPQFTSNKSPQSSGSVVATDSAAKGAAASLMVEQLPILLDEGHAAVRQLSDSNEAVRTLLLHLQSHLEADLAQVKRQVGEAEQRMEKWEEAQVGTEETVMGIRERLASIATEDEIKSLKAKVGQLGVDTTAEAWHKAWQGRLEEVEERLDRLAEDEEEGGPRKGGGVGSEEVARMVKTAVEDALLRQDRARQEEFDKWRQQLEKDMDQWRKRTEEEIKTEAGVAAASAIKGGLEECKAACKQVDEAFNNLKSNQTASAGGQAGVAGEGSSAGELEEQVQKLRKAIEEVDARGDNLTERLDEMLKTSDAVDEQLSQMAGDAEVLRERISTLERGQQKVAKWQEDFVNEPPDLRDVRAKLEGLSKAVDLVKAAPAADVGAASPAADDLASQVQALTERVDLFEESTEKRLEVFQDSVQQVETRIHELEVMVKEASAHVETLKVLHISSQMFFLRKFVNQVN